MKCFIFISISLIILSLILCNVDIIDEEVEDTLNKLQQQEDEHNKFEQHLQEEIMEIIKEKGYEGKEYLVKDEFKYVFQKLLFKESKDDSINDDLKEDDETLKVLTERIISAMPEKIYTHNVTSYFNSDKMVNVLMELLGQYNLDDIERNKDNPQETDL